MLYALTAINLEQTGDFTMNHKPEISILIPFRDNGTRKEQRDWLHNRWLKLFPSAEIIVSEDDGLNPFSKTIAVNNAYKKASSDIIAMVDADCWIDPKVILDSAARIRSGEISWSRPCDDVYKLTESFTKKLIKQDSDIDLVVTEEDYQGITKAIGFVVVFSRDQFEKAGGMDSRFRGWGGEDNAWNLMLTTLFGDAHEGVDVGYHFWHPVARSADGRKAWQGQLQKNTHIVKEYDQANGNYAKMLRIANQNKKRNNI